MEPTCSFKTFREVDVARRSYVRGVRGRHDRGQLHARGAGHPDGGQSGSGARGEPGRPHFRWYAGNDVAAFGIRVRRHAFPVRHRPVERRPFRPAVVGRAVLGRTVLGRRTGHRHRGEPALPGPHRRGRAGEPFPAGAAVGCALPRVTGRAGGHLPERDGAEAAGGAELPRAVLRRTHGVTDDSCPYAFTGPNLASELADADETFAGYAENLPSDGYTGCADGKYTRAHNPWVDFANVPAKANLTFDRFPQGHFKDLPTVSFVVPDPCHAMRDCSVATGDAWLKDNLGAYATWAQKHDSLLIVTADQSDSATGPNRVPLLVVGGPVRPGSYDEPVTHLSVLRTVEDLYGLPCTARACDAQPVTDIWRSPAAG